MAFIHEALSDQFYDWEKRGRGWEVFPMPVRPEPAFRPFEGHFLKNTGIVDDGHRPTFLSSFFEKITGGGKPPPPEPEEEAEPDPQEFEHSDLVELRTALPAKLNITRDACEAFLANLSNCRSPLVFEIMGTCEEISLQFACDRADAALTRRQLEAHFPEGTFVETANTLETAWNESTSEEALVVEFGLANEFMFQLRTDKADPFVGLVGALSQLQADEVAVFQVIFEPVQENWKESIEFSTCHADGKPFFVNGGDLAAAAKGKIMKPLYAAVVRIGILTDSFDRTLRIARDLAGSLSVFSNPQGNELIPLENEEYPFESHVEDLLSRNSRRTGMILTSDELIRFVHLPSSAVRSPLLLRETAKTKAAPAIANNLSGVLLGLNHHAGKTTEVRLTPEQRVKHMHVIGASGTGKSTLFLNLIRQDIENGQGMAFLDPHGDLVDRILTMIPRERVKDVVLVDPSDEEYSIGFNILSAHSDLEKTLLASDLISVFQRLSTSWGDQMGSVLQNAILAFLESDAGGTLADMRRFLIEPAFRERFLKTVRDPDVVYYWRKGFTQLSGNKSIGSVLTRLDTFLAPKPIRYMVSQTVNRLDFSEIMDGGKIFLAKLPQGKMGKENSFLLGSLFVSKFQQLAMSRQDMRAENRRDFWLYLDEFHNFMTPSMAEILSGARKYRLGLILAHQELRQLDKDRDVSSAVLSNPFTRVIFRVGDSDARSLESGLSFFEAQDLQNLETGKAIGRIEKANGDFNLGIPFSAEVSEAEGEARRKEVIAASRARYGTPRREIESALLAKLDQEEVAEPPKSRTKEKVATKPEPETSRVNEGQTVKIRPPTPSPSPSNVAEPPSPQVVEPVESEAPIDTPETKRPAQDKGIGGNQHNLIRERIEIVARALGYTTSREKETEDGGQVDVVLQKTERAIACEIAITTTVDHEVGNIAKCLKAGFKLVAVLAPSADRLKKIESGLRASVSGSEAAKVAFYHPDEFIAYLEKFKAEDAAGPVVQKPGERTVGKYKVKRSAAALTKGELKEREEAALRILAETMRKKE